MDTRIAAYAVVVEQPDGRGSTGRMLLAHWSGSGGSGWTLPGGGLEPGEDPADAAVREVAEETGYEVALDGLLGVDSFVADGQQCLRLVYRAHVTGGALRDEVGGSTDTAAWVDVDDVDGLDRVGLVDVGRRLAGLTPTTAAERVRAAAVELAALAQDGTTFATDPYDRSRYAQAARLATELLGAVSERDPGELRAELGRDSGYATPKVDVRGVLFDDDDRVLLMRERSDGRWAPPGGWADPGDTPTAAVLREVREETGYDAQVVRLVACYERAAQGHTPPLPVAVYKLFFLCSAHPTTGQVAPPQELETLDVGWFGLDELPPLSAARVTERQLRRALEHHRDPSLPADLD